MNTEFEYELEIEGHVIHVTVEAEARMYRDLYGADADGNRGEWRTEMDDLEIKIVDGRGKDITEKLSKKYKSEYEQILEKAEEELYEAYEN